MFLFRRERPQQAATERSRLTVDSPALQPYTVVMEQPEIASDGDPSHAIDIMDDTEALLPTAVPVVAATAAPTEAGVVIDSFPLFTPEDRASPARFALKAVLLVVCCPCGALYVAGSACLERVVPALCRSMDGRLRCRRQLHSRR